MNNKERTLARENIVKILYQNEISQNNIPNIVRTFIEKRKFDDIYFKEILTLLDKNMSIIDNLIYKNGNVAEFDASIIDKSILRLSVCEFLFRKDIPKKVKDEVKITPVEFADEVIRLALTKELKRIEWVEVENLSDAKKNEKSQASIQ